MGLLDDAIREHLDLKRRRGADPTEIEKAERDALGPVRRDRGSAAVEDVELPPVATEPGSSGPVGDFEFTPDELDEHPTTVASRAAEPPAVDDLLSADPLDDEPAGGIASSAYADTAFEDFAAETSDEEIPPPPADFDFPSERPIEAKEPKHKRRHLFGRHRHDHDEDSGFDMSAPVAPVPPPVLPPEDDPFMEEPVQPAPPRETGDGEAVGRAQPIQRDDAPRQPPPALQITPEAELGHTVEYDVEKAFAEEDESDEDILEETPEFLADTPDHDRLWFEQKPPPDFDFDA